MNEVSTIQKIKSIIINIDPQDVLKDAKEYGLEVQTLEDFENKADNYVFIEKLANKYGDVAARYCAISGASSGIGGIATTVTLASVDISNMAAQLYRLNQKISHQQKISYHKNQMDTSFQSYPKCAPHQPSVLMTCGISLPSTCVLSCATAARCG